MNALRNVHRMLVPKGLVVDAHPVPPNGRAIVDGTDVGPVHEEEFFRTVRATERELARVVREGLLDPVGELEFWVDEQYPSAEDLLLDLDEGDWGRVSDRVRARIARGDSVQLREHVVMRSFRAR